VISENPGMTFPKKKRINNELLIVGMAGPYKGET